ncbi:hypothetical protein QFZ40_001605 [Arthrobacter pascens]|nr:hypothetical protein [Arthrobacter pascens]
MAITAIVSYTNMWKQTLILTNTEHPDWRCNTCSADTDRTIWRDKGTLPNGDPAGCCDMWIPWCDEAGGFLDHHMILKSDGSDAPLADIWQARHDDGVFVRWLDHAEYPKIRSHIGALKFADASTIFTDCPMNGLPDGWRCIGPSGLAACHVNEAMTLRS